MTDTATLEAILGVVRQKTGLDFSGYRRSTIARRVRNRMASIAQQSLHEYFSLLAASEIEARALVDRLTINVSRFYRNAPAFDLLRRSVLPQLAAAARGRPLALWSAGCARGEEAYSLAMLLVEQGIPGRVWATDIDAGALAAAEAAVYGEAALKELPLDLRARFLEPAAPERGWRVRDEVRRRVTFALHDVCGAAPALRHDIVACRNVLIYLDRPSQERVLRNLDSALAGGGYLLLGEAEAPPAGVLPACRCVSHRARLFRSERTAGAAT